MPRRPEPRTAAIVLGCDEIGSAVAHRLHRDGFAVVLIDGVDPPHPRRGMAFTDAWYVGSAQLSGVAAVFCASVRSIPSVLDRSVAVAATTWSWGGVASALAPLAIVETRAPSARRPVLDRRALPPLMTLEVVPGAVVGPEFDVAIALPPPRGLRERVVYAACDGRFGTHRSIGEQVRSGDMLGTLGGEAILAPIDGSLRGLSARGARLCRGNELVEIDPGADPTRCFGLDPRASAIAEGVSRALRDEVRPGVSPTRARAITATP